MNIVFVLDKNYSSYLEVALKSVHYHHHNVNIYIIHDGISRAELTRVGQYLAHRGNSLYDLYIEDVNKLIVFPTVGSPDHIGAFSLVRLFVHRLLPEHLDKVIYLDVDVIINKPIDELWNIDIDNYLLGAVTDYGMEFHWFHKYFDKQQYINSGVMLINLNKWRELNVDKYFIDGALKYGKKFEYGDQDTINFSLSKELIKLLPIGFNFQVGLLEDRLREADIDLSPHFTFVPNIIHYTGKFKPWLNEDHEDFPKFYKDNYIFYQNLDWNSI